MPEVDEVPTREWHALSTTDCLHALHTGSRGMTEAQVQVRLAQHGQNEVGLREPPSALSRFARQFDNPLLFVLLGAAAITASLAHWTDTAVILGVVIINALIGFVQEGRAEKALLSIQHLLAPVCQVVREGEAKEIPARLLVPGDIVLLRSGDRVPADLRLLECHNLEVEESILTGESVPVIKNPAALSIQTELSDRWNMAHAGTLVTRGVGQGVTCATGTQTALGQISETLQHIEPIRTPLLLKFARLGRQLSYLIVVLAAAIAAFGIGVRGLAVDEMLIAAVSIAVAAIPEGLPPVVTITLAIGVQLMARRHAIVRRLAAVETLGEVTVICSDKTGTLTRNEMTVRTIELPTGRATVTGVGYAPEGEILLNGDSAIQLPANLVALLRAGLNCNDARLVRQDEDWHISGDPTEGALLTLAAKAGMQLHAPPDRMPRLDVIPFQSEERFMASLHAFPPETPGGVERFVVFAKGAPETLLAMCSAVLGAEQRLALDPEGWLRTASDLAAAGQRVLALATCELDAGASRFDRSDIDGHLLLLGLVGVTDPAREEARAALDQCRTAGIRVKMITGDHIDTAIAIGSELGLGEGKRAVGGSELDGLDDTAFDQIARDVDIFARTTPEHKLRLVTALQNQGAIVAMTGDGVNDAPALKRADIGVAMGRKGTEAAKEAAQMVIADDNFATIVNAVKTGRTIDDNIKKSVVFLLPTSIAEALMIALAILAGYQLPITPLQILWVNMITAVTLGLALAFERPHNGVMQRPPRPANEPMLSGFVIWRCTFVSLLILIGVLALHGMEKSSGASLDYARTTAVSALVWFEAVYLISARRLSDSSLNMSGIFGNRIAMLSIGVVAVLQILFTYTMPFQVLFASKPLSLESWAAIAVAGIALFLVVEVEKFIRARCWRTSD